MVKRAQNENIIGYEEYRADRGERSKTIVEQLIDFGQAAELWHTPDHRAYATITVDGHREHWPVREHGFRMWLTGGYYRQSGKAPGGSTMQDAIAVLEAGALHDGPTRDVHVRVGGAGGKVYVDLCNARWQAVEIDREGWRVTESPPIAFRRPRGLLPMPDPMPHPDGARGLEDLHEFLNLDDDDLRIVTGYLIGSLQPLGGYPVLVLNGPAGAGKSTAARMLRELVDPNFANLRPLPRDERDAMIAATNSWLITFDNVSSVPLWLGDTICRLATGGGLATRQLHTDTDEIILDARRPVMLNGIGEILNQSDLADRALGVSLHPLEDRGRRSERQLGAEYQARRPYLMGALFDAVSASLRNRDQVDVSEVPRLADFAVAVAAAEGELGWPVGAFREIYNADRSSLMRTIAANDVLGAAVRDFVDGGHWSVWEGSASELLAALRRHYAHSDGPDVTASRAFPQSAAALGGKINRVAPALAATGILVSRGRVGKSRDRVIRIEPAAGGRTAGGQQIRRNPAMRTGGQRIRLPFGTATVSLVDLRTRSIMKKKEKQILSGQCRKVCGFAVRLSVPVHGRFPRARLVSVGAAFSPSWRRGGRGVVCGASSADPLARGGWVKSLLPVPPRPASSRTFWSRDILDFFCWISGLCGPAGSPSTAWPCGDREPFVRTPLR